MRRSPLSSTFPSGETALISSQLLAKGIRFMSSLDKREDGFEKKFAHDQELRFKAAARRNKLLGHWAAEKLGKTGADAQAYAKTVIAADLEESGDDDVFRKVHADFTAAGVSQSEHQIRRTMDELMAEAIKQIQAGA
jgi:hypothetical protein